MIAQADNVVDDRPKNFLTEAEITSFLKAARKGRHGIRNYAMALLAYRHGLRVSELINLRMADLDLDTGHLFVRRLKGSLSTSQPLEGDEIRVLRTWLRQRVKASCCNSPLLLPSGPPGAIIRLIPPFWLFLDIFRGQNPKLHGASDTSLRRSLRRLGLQTTPKCRQQDRHPCLLAPIQGTDQAHGQDQRSHPGT